MCVCVWLTYLNTTFFARSVADKLLLNPAPTPPATLTRPVYDSSSLTSKEEYETSRNPLTSPAWLDFRSIDPAGRARLVPRCYHALTDRTPLKPRSHHRAELNIGVRNTCRPMETFASHELERIPVSTVPVKYLCSELRVLVRCSVCSQSVRSRSMWRRDRWT